jgi:hypothetical protein
MHFGAWAYRIPDKKFSSDQRNKVKAQKDRNFAKASGSARYG